MGLTWPASLTNIRLSYVSDKSASSRNDHVRKKYAGTKKSATCWDKYSPNRLAEEVEGRSEANSWSATTGAEWASRRSDSGGSWSDVVRSEQQKRHATDELASEYIGHVVPARSANHITERQAHEAGTKSFTCRELYIVRPVRGVRVVRDIGAIGGTFFRQKTAVTRVRVRIRPLNPTLSAF